MVPERANQQIRFCRNSDGTRIAYAVTGGGPPIVKAPHWLTHLEYEWRSPIWRPWIEALSRRNTLVRMDERGCGLSDWEIAEFSLEAYVRDLITAGRLVEVLADWQPRFPGPFLYYPSRRQVPPALEAFVAFVRDWRNAGQRR